MNRYKTRKNKRKSVLYSKIAAISVVAAILIVGSVYYLSHRPQKVDTSNGLSIIHEYEKKDVSSVEAKIVSVEAQEKLAEYQAGNISLKEMFASSVIMGDSITEGFSAYDILNANSVISKIGGSLTDLDEQYEQLKQINPQFIFLAYGLNDILNTDGDTDTFIQEYRTFVTNIQQDLPNAKIYINSIFPVLQRAIAKKPALTYISSYNESLQNMCSELGITYIDNTSLVSDNYYGEDGIHFNADFYPIWAGHMLEVSLS